MVFNQLLQIFNVTYAAAKLHGIDYAIIAVILLIVAAIVFSMIRHKKKNGGCYGCAHSKSCGAANTQGCPSSQEQTKK